MTSLKRSLATDVHAANISSKVFVRSTKSGKVQKIVRELYLRQDIPCSSKLCTACLSIVPVDANGNGMGSTYIALPSDVLQHHRSSCPSGLLEPRITQMGTI